MTGADLYQRFAQGEVYIAWTRPLDDDGLEVPDRWRLTIDGDIELSEEERATLEADQQR